MRFMIIRKADKDTEAGCQPSTQLLTDMLAYHEDMAKAGVLITGEGLQPSAKGVRIKLSDGKPSVTDGPFLEAEDFGEKFTAELREQEELLRARSENPA